MNPDVKADCRYVVELVPKSAHGVGAIGALALAEAPNQRLGVGKDPEFGLGATNPGKLLEKLHKSKLHGNALCCVTIAVPACRRVAIAYQIALKTNVISRPAMVGSIVGAAIRPEG